MPSNPCSDCGKHRPIFGGGRCHACFAVWGAENDLAPNEMPQRCAVDGCSAFAAKRGGLCDRHYRRVQNNGTVEKVRAVSEMRQHPQYRNWLHFRTHGLLCEAWQDFWVFIAAVGERPVPRAKLQRPDRSAVYGPENFAWRAAKLDTVHTAITRDGRNAYQNALRAISPRYWVGSNLRRYYGMTIEQYDALLSEQGGGCAICGRKSDIDPKGKPQLLAVDHDHRTMEIRGLLCREHNVMLGHSGDDPAALRRGADYLERQQHTGLFAPRAGDEQVLYERPSGITAPVAGAVCSADACARPIKAQGLCTMHYARLLRTGSADLTRRQHAACSVDGCDRTAIARGMCHKHYEHAHRTGRLALSCDEPPSHLN